MNRNGMCMELEEHYMRALHHALHVARHIAPSLAPSRVAYCTWIALIPKSYSYHFNSQPSLYPNRLHSRWATGAAVGRHCTRD